MRTGSYGISVGQPMPAQLVALTDGPSILLDKPILLFGRHPECDIQIDSRKISRRHCCIAQVGDYLVVRDLDSTNGIRINGVRLREGRIKSGDELTIGGCRYKVCWDELEAAELRSQLASRPKAPVAPLVGQPAEDDLLESCDEPVPLPDDANVLEPVATPRRSDPLSGLRRPMHVKDPTAPDPMPCILPEQLDLMPVSDADLPKPGSAPL